jgi:cytochrome c1
MKWFVPLALLTLLSAGCGGVPQAHDLTGGDPVAGKAAMKRYGCISCHTIPGVEGATALVGPPLTHMARRAYVAGVLVNNPENLQEWILDPPGVDQKTAMPNLRVTRPDARDIAAYLYTLQ